MQLIYNPDSADEAFDPIDEVLAVKPIRKGITATPRDNNIWVADTYDGAELAPFAMRSGAMDFKKYPSLGLTP
jgi:hypothetical protein